MNNLIHYSSMIKIISPNSLNKIISSTKVWISAFLFILFSLIFNRLSINNYKKRLFVSFAKIMLLKNIAKRKTPIFVFLVITAITIIDLASNIEEHKFHKNLK